jgi:cell wall-associated NlpC family hydrolase
MPLSIEQREAIVREANTWIGTPYRGWSRFKGPGGGTDCGQYIYQAFRNCGLIPEVPIPTDYSLQVAQHRASRAYVDFIDQFCRPIEEAEVQPGDLVLYQLGRAYAHGAIIVSWPDSILQADGRHGVSGAHGTKTPAFRRAPRVFRTLKDEFCGGGF